MDEIRYLISDASRKVDVETHVLRYWEEELGLMIPRNELGHRYYTEFHIRLFCQVKALKDKGYQLKAIKNALQQVMGTEQEQRIQAIAERDLKIREAASLLEQDITRALQSDPRLKDSLKLSLDKQVGGAGEQKATGPVTDSKIVSITHLSDYSRLETGAVTAGLAPGSKAPKQWGPGEKREKWEDLEQADADGERKTGDERKVESEKRVGTERKAENERRAGTERRAENERRAGTERRVETERRAETERRIEDERDPDGKKRVEDRKNTEDEKSAGIEEKTDHEGKAEKDGQMDMKSKKKDRRKPSAWERRNGVVSGTKIKGENMDSAPRKEDVRSIAAKQEEIVSRAVRKEGAGKACVDRILAGADETEWEAWPIDQIIEETYEQTGDEDGTEGARLKGAGTGDAKAKGAGIGGTEAKGAVAGGAQIKGAVAGGAQIKGAGAGGTQIKGAGAGGAQIKGACAGGMRIRGTGADDIEIKGAGAGDTESRGAGAGSIKVKGASRDAEMKEARTDTGEEARTDTKEEGGAAEGRAAAADLAGQEAAVTAIAVQESVEDTGLTPMTQEEKLEQFQAIMDHIIGRALEANNEKLSQDISRLVNDELVEEMADLMRIRDEREEERFRHLDEVIRSCQRDRLGRAEAAAARIPFFMRKRFGRDGRHPQSGGRDF